MNRNIQNIDDDICRKKRIIEDALCGDVDLVELIDNADIDPTCPEELMYENIFPFINIPGAQDTAKSFICYTIDDNDVSQRNAAMKNQFVRFVAFVHKDLVKTKYGVARHDIIGFVIRDIFNLSNMLGGQMILTSDVEGYTDSNYCSRTLRFEIVTDNSFKPLKTNPHEYNRIIGHRG